VYSLKLLLLNCLRYEFSLVTQTGLDAAAMTDLALVPSSSSSSSNASASAAPKKQKSARITKGVRKNKPKLDPRISLETVQTLRTGYTRLVHVKQFRDMYLELLKQLKADEKQASNEMDEDEEEPDLRFARDSKSHLSTC